MYSAMWTQLNAGFADQWFYSSAENMEVLSTMYDRLFDYFQPKSEYEKTLTEGWPDSTPINNSSKKDLGQFTNEILKPKHDRSTSLMKYPRWQCINNHLLHKWFFIECGLYDKSKFLKG